MNFSGDSFDVVYVLNLVFLEDLDSDLLRGEVVDSELDLSEGALTDGLAQQVVADILWADVGRAAASEAGAHLDASGLLVIALVCSVIGATPSSFT